MSRSYRHTPIIGNCSHSDKPGKLQANRAYRRRIRAALHVTTDFDALVLPAIREVSNVWDFPKDGKSILFGWDDVEHLRKLMRK